MFDVIHISGRLQAKGKVKKAEKALQKVQEYLEPADLPTDLETINDEERFLFRKIGLSMKPYLLLGKDLQLLFSVYCFHRQSQACCTFCFREARDLSWYHRKYALTLEVPGAG